MTTFQAAGTVAAQAAILGTGRLRAAVGGQVVVNSATSSAPDPARRARALDLIGPAMVAFLVAASEALDPPVGRVALYPGLEVAWDDCCDGQAWIRLHSVLPQGSGQQGANQQPCGVLLWNVTFGLGVLRCVATLDENGEAPTPAELIADTLQMTADQAALQQAIQCDIAPTVDRLTIVRWDPLGPQGGCAGGEWLFTVKVGNCDCPA